MADNDVLQKKRPARRVVTFMGLVALLLAAAGIIYYRG